MRYLEFLVRRGKLVISEGWLGPYEFIIIGFKIFIQLEIVYVNTKSQSFEDTENIVKTK